MESEKIKQVKKNIEIKNKLNCFGFYGIVGPTGPRGLPGTNIMIKGSYDSLEELEEKRPQGEMGDTYLVNGDLYYWNVDTQKWEKIGDITGPTGPKGEKGEKGDIGETGPQGKEGKIGPTGPKGEKGEKGDTGETGPQGKEGKIGPTGPKGEKGEKGYIGETGPQGKEGKIGPTGPKGEKGEKGDTGETGPQGKKGEIGPTGPKGEKGNPYGLLAYGERYSNSIQRFNVIANTETIIPLEQTGGAFFTRYNTSYSIEVKKSGMFQISYFLNIATSVDTSYEVFLRKDSIKIPGSDILGTGKANEISRVSGIVLFALLEDEEISLLIKTKNTTDLIFDGSTNAKLSIIKVD